MATALIHVDFEPSNDPSVEGTQFDLGNGIIVNAGAGQAYVDFEVQCGVSYTITMTALGTVQYPPVTFDVYVPEPSGPDYHGPQNPTW